MLKRPEFALSAMDNKLDVINLLAVADFNEEPGRTFASWSPRCWSADFAACSKSSPITFASVTCRWNDGWTTAPAGWDCRSVSVCGQVENPDHLDRREIGVMSLGAKSSLLTSPMI